MFAGLIFSLSPGFMLSFPKSLLKRPAKAIIPGVSQGLQANSSLLLTWHQLPDQNSRAGRAWTTEASATRHHPFYR